MWCFRGRTLTDEEYVQRVRRQVAFFNRWRRPWVAICIVLLLALLVAAVMVVETLQRLAQGIGGQGVTPGLVIGLMMGAMLGLQAIGLTFGLVVGFRADRTALLLLIYHDALKSPTEEPVLQNLSSAPGVNCEFEEDYLSECD
jgi:hypothetical protein